MHAGNLFAFASGCDLHKNELVRTNWSTAVVRKLSWVGKDLMNHENRESMEEIHLRILRITDDLRVIQRELNCAAMQAPTDPELMEALSDPPEMESITMLKSALDQMRHFLWFYSQVMSNEPELGDKLRQATATKTATDGSPKLENSFLDQLSRADELVLLHHMALTKQRKPN